MSEAKAISAGDVVLIHVQEQPAFFARVEAIEPDAKRGWWQVKFLILTLPLTVTTWIIDNEQIRGAEFTLGGTPIRIERVIAPEEAAVDAPGEETGTSGSESSPKRARILSLGDRNKD